ncbi:MAG: iron ABC transporter permease, partial [Pseudomonadota bacterium]
MIKNGLRVLAWLTVCLCMFPIVSVVLSASGGTLDTWSSLMATVLPGYFWTTVQLIILVGIGTAIIGAT